MAITQLSVYLVNEPGSLSRAVNAISEAGVNIRALSLADTKDFGILRLIVSDIDKTRQILDAHTIATETPVIAVKMKDKAGSLNTILQILDTEDINIEYIYAFTSSGPENAYVVLRVDDTETAEKVLERYGETVLSDEDLKELL